MKNIKQIIEDIQAERGGCLADCMGDNEELLIRHFSQLLPKWISVKDDLPKKTSQYYLVTIYDASFGKRWVGLAMFNKDGWDKRIGLDNLTWITHWMEKPDPAKGFI